MDAVMVRRILRAGTPQLDNDNDVYQGINYTGRADFCLDGRTVRGLFKWCGYDEGTRYEGNMEIAVRWIAKHFFPFVELPEAVMRDYTPLGYEGRGAVQRFVADAKTAWPSGKCTLRREVMDAFDMKSFKQDAIGATLFDKLIANSDRHGYNWLWRANPGRGQRHIILIDHGSGYVLSATGRLVSGGEYREACEGMMIPVAMREGLHRLSMHNCAYLRRLGVDWYAVAGLRERARKLALRESV